LTDENEEDEEEINLEDILIPIPVVVTHEHNPQPLTPPGNLTLVDDTSVDSIDEKQFLTVVTKNGNYFYIVVDRDGNTENVHFLNLVDELDLLALLEDDVEIPEKAQPEPYVPPQAQVTEPEPEPEPENGFMGSLIGILVVVGLIGAGVGVYFKIIKPKQANNTTGTLTSDDEFGFDEDDEDFEGNKDEDEGDEDEETAEDEIVEEEIIEEDDPDDVEQPDYASDEDEEENGEYI